jgi:hypothetical protein
MLNLEEHCNYKPGNEKNLFETTWNNRKTILELNKLLKFVHFPPFTPIETRDGTLEQVIDLSLKDYIEMHEKAHAVRLQFESEKSDWTRKIRQDMSDEMDVSRAKQ